MEVGFHRKWILSRSFFSVGRIVCSENRRSTGPFTALPHATSSIQHREGGNDSREIHPAPINLVIGDEEKSPSITHEDLVKLGVEPRLVPSFISGILQVEQSPNHLPQLKPRSVPPFISSISRIEQSPNYPPQLTPVEAQTIIELLEKVTPP